MTADVPAAEASSGPGTTVPRLVGDLLGLHAARGAGTVPTPGTASVPSTPPVEPRVHRTLLGVAGQPGAGKSTLAAQLVDGLQAAGVPAALVPMDGFHLAQRELERLGRADRKGAPDTFDVDGYLALLERLRAPGGRTVYAPELWREIEEPVAGAVPVTPDVEVVVTEGNYLLHDGDGWAGVRSLLDAVWYLDVPDDLRLERLVARHVRHGRSPDAARAWALGPDERNAVLVARTRPRADRLVRL